MANILLVEDDPNLLDIYRDVLTDLGHRVSVAQNGQEALDRASLSTPDLILMDIQMPVMDGLEATARLKANPELDHVPIYALTNLQLPDEVQAALEAGCDGYFAKPADPQELAAEIAMVLAEEESLEERD